MKNFNDDFDKMQKSVSSFAKVGIGTVIAVWIFNVVVYVSIISLIGYVAYHFLAKFW